MGLKKSQRSLKKWTAEDWTTESGKPSTQGPEATGEVLGPKAKIDALRGTQELANRNAIKQRARAAGQQYAKHGLHSKTRTA